MAWTHRKISAQGPILPALRNRTGMPGQIQQQRRKRVKSWITLDAAKSGRQRILPVFAAIFLARTRLPHLSILFLAFFRLK
jgi:hypothetical protein